MSAALLLPLPAAAAHLGVSKGTLKRWIGAGAPVALPGRRGRGGAHLVDPEAIAAWRRLGASTPVPGDELRVYVAQLRALIARCMDEQLRQLDGPHKVATGFEFGQAYFGLLATLHEAARAYIPDLPAADAEMPHDLARWFEPHRGGK